MFAIELLQRRHLEHLQHLKQKILWRNSTIKYLKAVNETKCKEIKHMTSKITQLESRNQSLRLYGRVYDPSIYIPPLQKVRPKQIAPLQEQIVKLNEDIESQAAENEYLNAYIETATKQFKQNLYQIQREYEKIRCMNNKLQQDQSKISLENSNDMKHYNSKLLELNKEIIELEKENVNLKNILSQKRKSESRKLLYHQCQLEDSEKEQVKLINEVDALKRFIDEREVSISKYKQQVGVEMEELKGHLAKSNQELQVKHYEEMIHEQNMKTKEQEIIENNNQFADMKRKLSGKKQIENHEQEDSRLSQYTNEHKSESVAREIQKENALIQCLEKQLSKNKLQANTLEKIKSENKQLKKNLEESKKQYADIGHIFQKAISRKDDVERKLVQKDDTINDLRRLLVQKPDNEKYSEKQLSLEDDWKNDLERQIMLKDDTINGLDDAIKKMKRQIVQKDGVLKDYKRQISDQKVSLETKHNEHFKVNVAEKDKEILDLQQHLSEAKLINQRCQQKIQISEDKVNKQAKENAALSKAFEAQERQHADELKKLYEQFSELREENCLLNKQLQQLQRQISEPTEENPLLTKQLQQLQSSPSPELKAAEKAITEKNKKIEELSNRLAKEMSSKISADERALENVSVKNRPMNIASEYELLCSNEWHDAKGILDQLCQQMKEEDKINVLRFIFEVSEQKCNRCFNMVMNQFDSMLEQPMENFQQQSHSATSSSVTDEVKISVGDCLRKSADTANIRNVVQDVLSEAGTKYHIEASTVFAHNNFHSFVEACVRLGWKMVLQRPPMCFVQDGIREKWQGDGKQELFWRSSDPSDPLSRVKYYVHPALHHGETMMVKGRVYLSRV